MSATAPLLVFDLDGTLVDSRQDLADSTNALLQSYGAAALPDDVVTAMVGDGARMLVERAVTMAEIDCDVDAALARFLDIYSGRLLANTVLYDGIATLLGEIGDRAHMAVLTNKPGDLAERIIGELGLADYFMRVVGGDAPFPRKPDPTGLLMLIDEAGAIPSRTLMVGDSMVDIETGRRAGTRVCAAAYGFGHLRHPLQLETGEFRADRVADLGPIIEQMIRG